MSILEGFKAPSLVFPGFYTRNPIYCRSLYHLKALYTTSLLNKQRNLKVQSTKRIHTVLTILNKTQQDYAHVPPLMGFRLRAGFFRAFPIWTFGPNCATFTACALKAQAMKKWMPTSGNAIPSIYRYPGCINLYIYIYTFILKINIHIYPIHCNSTCLLMLPLLFVHCKHKTWNSYFFKMQPKQSQKRTANKRTGMGRFVYPMWFCSAIATCKKGIPKNFGTWIIINLSS